MINSFFEKLFNSLALQIAPVYAFQYDADGYPIESEEETEDEFIIDDEDTDDFISEEPSPDMEL